MFPCYFFGAFNLFSQPVVVFLFFFTSFFILHNECNSDLPLPHFTPPIMCFLLFFCTHCNVMSTGRFVSCRFRCSLAVVIRLELLNISQQLRFKETTTTECEKGVITFPSAINIANSCFGHTFTRSLQAFKNRTMACI